MMDFAKVFSISQLIPKKEFNELTKKWAMDKGVIKFNTQKFLDILILSLVFEKRNLRDISDSYAVPKSTLDDALRKRSYGFFQDLCSLILKELISLTEKRKERQDLRELLAIDSSLCHAHGSMANQFIATKIENKTAGVKFHAVWNVNQQWIEDFKVTGYRNSDGRVAKDFCFSKGKTYVFDRAYVDLKLWLKIQKANSHFVTRLRKHGQRLSHIHDVHIKNESVGVLYDKKWTPSETTAYKAGLKPKTVFYRHIIYRDPESKKLFDFITSDSDSDALEIANIYRQRWAVELLFRWLKGHLNIRRFAYKNMNAIKILLAVTVLVQLLVRFKMLKENFTGTSWDYLRSWRNILDRIFYQTIMGSEFPTDRVLFPLPIEGLRE
ncbi:MAG: IS4 family transposase [Pseudobdellovibrionaceae bacterium]